jgi:3-dehydroquinate dehydratase-2
MSAKRILIINGPNLNLLGKREPETYGTESFEEILVKLKSENDGIQLDYFQSNIEGEIINEIQSADVEGIVLNAAGYSHTSISIRDVIAAVDTRVVEVHISNISARESFRHDSLIGPVCVGCISGFGIDSYRLAIKYFTTL